MKKLIHSDDGALGELHCDNPKCDYIAPSGLHDFGPHLIGTPCPQCGESLLTPQDYQACLRIMRLVGWFNKWFGWLGTEPRDPEPDDVIVSIRPVRGEYIVHVKKEGEGCDKGV